MSLPQSLGPYPSGTTRAYTPADNITNDVIDLGRLNDLVLSRLFDAKAVTAVVTNNTNTTVTNTVLELYEMVGGREGTIAYDLGVGMPAASPPTPESNEVNLTRGILANARLRILYYAPPTSGSVSAQLAFQSGGGGVMGAAGPLTTLANGYYPGYGSNRPLLVTGMGTVVFVISGNMAATLSFQGALENGWWFPIQATWVDTNGIVHIGTSALGPGLYVANVAGLNWAQVSVSSYTSGAVTIKAQATPNPNVDKVSQAQITGTPKTSTANPSGGSANQIPCDTTQTALAANANRKRWTIQNINTGAVFVKLGATPSAANDFHFILQGGVAANDGKGGSYTDDLWTGPVQVLGQGAAGANKVAVTEL